MAIKQSNDLTKSQIILFLIAVMLSNIAVMGDNVLFPISHNLYSAFPNSVSAVNYILSGPPILIVISALILPFILKIISKRTAMIIGEVLFTLGSVFGVLIESASWMVFTRSLVGIGQGFVQVCAIALIADVYVDEIERSKYIGFFYAAQNIIGLIFTYFTGLVAAASTWQNVFKLYYLSIPMLIMCLFFIPKLDSESSSQDNAVKKETTKKRLGFECWSVIIQMLILSSGCMIISYFISVYVADNNLGTEALSGNALAVAAIVSALVTFVFGSIYKNLKRYTVVIAGICSVLSFVVLYFSHSVASVYIAAILNGIAYVSMMSYAFTHCANIVSPDQVDRAIGLVTASYGIGSFLATNIATGVMSIMHTDSFTSTTIVYTAFGAITAIYGLCIALGNSRKKTV
jgi:MFS family permease